jgi:hypothetical protein
MIHKDYNKYIRKMHNFPPYLSDYNGDYQWVDLYQQDIKQIECWFPLERYVSPTTGK